VADTDDLADRDYDRYEGYWHGFTFIIFDGQQPDGRWIRSTYWVEVAGFDGDADAGSGDQPD
jgi:hypothetical protein